MSRQSRSPDSKQVKPPKERVVRARIDAELASQIEAKAKEHGWSVATVIRALLRRWLHEDMLSESDINAETKRAPKVSKSKPRLKRKG